MRRRGPGGLRGRLAFICLFLFLPSSFPTPVSGAACCNPTPAPAPHPPPLQPQGPAAPLALPECHITAPSRASAHLCPPCLQCRCCWLRCPCWSRWPLPPTPAARLNPTTPVGSQLSILGRFRYPSFHPPGNFSLLVGRRTTAWVECPEGATL